MSDSITEKKEQYGIADRIKQIRKEYGMSQEQFGNTIKITRSAVAKLESGENEPAERTKELICSRFNVTKKWLETGEEPRFGKKDFTSVAVAIDRGDPKARQAILDYWELSAEDKELFWKFVDRFIKRQKVDE